MKKKIGNWVKFSVVAASMVMTMKGWAQPDPPDLPSEHGKTGNYNPSAPLDGGVETMLILAVGYGGIVMIRKRIRKGSACQYARL